MNLDDLMNEESDLKDRYEENKNICALLDERARMSKVNQLDYKVSSIFVISLITYVLFFGVSIISIASIGIETISTILGPYLPLEIGGVSLVIGLLENAMINKKYKIKQRFKNFSNAQTESEKIEEQLYYELKLEQMKNRNLILEKVMNMSQSKELNIIDLSKYKGIGMNILPKELEKVLQNKENLSMELEQSYNELDLLTIQKQLTSDLCKFRIKGQDIIETITKGMIAGMFPFMLLFMPLIPLTMLEIVIPSILPFMELGLLGISMTSTTIYNLHKNRIQKKYFNKLNDLLGENKLSRNVENVQEEIDKINRLIERKISDIWKVELQMEECKKSLETLGSTEDIEKVEEYFKTISSKKDIEKEDKIFELIENPKEHIKETPQMYIDCPPKVGIENIYKDEEFKQIFDEFLNQELPVEEKSKVLTKRKK